VEQWSSQEFSKGDGGFEADPPAAEGKKDLEAKPPALGDFFCNFSIKITLFYAYFGQNNYSKQ